MVTFAAILPSFRPFGFTIRARKLLVGTASGAVKNRTIKRLLPDERWNGSLVAEAHSTKCTGGRWRQSWDHSTRVATTRGSPSTSFRLIFDKCVERNCAEPTSTSLATQRITHIRIPQTVGISQQWWTSCTGSQTHSGPSLTVA